jgi:predicted N-acetyltransferase YhbS
MHIDYLTYHRHFLPTLAGWMYREWLQPLGLALAHAERQLSQRLRTDQLPLALIAFTDEALGMVSLVEEAVPEGYGLGACLAGLYVAPARRRLGVGGRLCQRALLEAQRLGHAKLGLYTAERQAFYAGLGWVKCVDTVVETGAAHQIATFMEYAVSAVTDPPTPGLRWEARRTG